MKGNALIAGAVVALGCQGRELEISAQVVESCVAGERPAALVSSRPALSGLGFRKPVQVLQAPGDASAWYVVEQGETGSTELPARVLRVEPGGSSQVFVDLTHHLGEQVCCEIGLLGMAFHPAYQSNGQVFFAQTETTAGAEPSDAIDELVVRRHLRQADGTLESQGQEILRMRTGFGHTAGTLVFGPDGYLYLSVGEGHMPEAAQSLDSFRGKLLRIDVDSVGDNSTGGPYAVPPDNPFVGVAGAKPEIFALGLRNPWKLSFDRETGDLWLGDVGADDWEEINRIEPGGNYGWPVMEGPECRESGCDPSVFDAPVAAYAHEGTSKSIIGGFVYRGKQIPSLLGHYVFADFATGEVFHIDPSEPGKIEALIHSGTNPTTLGEGLDGELIILGSGISEGAVGGAIQLAPAPASTATAPRTLAETGCFDSVAGLSPAASLYEYQVNSPLWSDGAQKRRFLSLPPDGQITLRADGDFELPIGTVLIKSFERDGQRLETRLLMRHSDGGWAGYAYQWNDRQTQATLVAERGATVPTDQGLWKIPSRTGCRACHTAAAGHSLGLEVAQLNRRGLSGQNQLDELQAKGWIGSSPSLVAESKNRLPDPRDVNNPNIGARVRSYLHANCSSCHRPGGPASRLRADLRYGGDDLAVPPGVCNVEAISADSDLNGEAVLVPGNPAASSLLLRMNSRGEGQMPPLGSDHVDAFALALLANWIARLQECPAP